MSCFDQYGSNLETGQDGRPSWRRKPLTRSANDPTRRSGLATHALLVAQCLTLLTCASVTAIALAYAAFLVSPQIFGFRLVQSHGISMEPLLSEGDILLLHAINGAEAQIGDVVVTDRNGRAVLHRLIAYRVHETGGLLLVTKGDNAAQADAPISPSAVQARLVTRLPLLGLLLWSFEGEQVALLYAAALIVATLIFLRRRRRFRSLRRLEAGAP